MSDKKCPKCGAVFRCEGDKDCWCESVNIHRVRMLEVIELYTDCLCPDCLNGYKAGE